MKRIQHALLLIFLLLPFYTRTMLGPTASTAARIAAIRTTALFSTTNHKPEALSLPPFSQLHLNRSLLNSLAM